MKLLPVVERELVVRARSPHMHWSRLVFAALGALLCLQFFLLWLGRSASVSLVGGYAFQTLAWLVFLSSASGFVLTADSVSSERREGTLGLLLLTRIGIPDVLAGKLVSAGLTAFLGLASVTPVLMLPVLAGGVRWTQVVLVAFSLPGVLFFSLCTGLWASTRSDRMGQAMTRAALGVAALLLLPLIVGLLLRTAGASSSADWVGALSPGSAFLHGTGGGRTFTEPGYYVSVAIGFLLGWIVLGIAARDLRGSWHENEFPRPSQIEQRLRKRTPLRADAPVQWLLSRSKAQSRALWLGAVMLLVPNLINVVRGMVGFTGIGMSYAVSLASVGAAGLAFAHGGARFLLNARQTGELELLCTTPEGFRTVVADQWVVLRRRLVVPLGMVIAVRLIAWLIEVNRFTGVDLISSLIRTTPSLVGVLFDVVALCWLGMWFGYHARSTWTALLWPVALVEGLDLLLSYGVYAVLGLGLRGAAFRGGMGTMFLTLLVTLPQLLSIAKQVWLIRWARRRLRETLASGLREPVELRRAASRTAQRALAAVQQARHWTGGGV